MAWGKDEHGLGGGREGRQRGGFHNDNTKGKYTKQAISSEGEKRYEYLKVKDEREHE